MGNEFVHTLHTLNEKLDREITWIRSEVQKAERRAEERADRQDESVKIALVVMEERLKGMNEFREQLNKERGTYVTRDSLSLILAPLQERDQWTRGRDKAIVVFAGILATVVSVLVQYLLR